MLVIRISDMGKSDYFPIWVNQNDFPILENRITDIRKYADLPISEYHFEWQISVNQIRHIDIGNLNFRYR